MNAIRYNFVMYDVTMIQQFLGLLSSAKGKNISSYQYAFIYHDKDILEATGEPKKAHFHLWLEFPEAVKSMFIDKILEACGGNASMRSNKKTDRNFLAYLTHDTTNSGLKARYNYEDIITNIEPNEFKEMYLEAISNANRPNKQKQEIDMITKIYEIVSMNNDIISVSSLMNYIINSNDNDLKELMPYIMKRGYGLNMALKDVFENNSMILSSQELESQNQSLLSSNKKKMHHLQALRNRQIAQAEYLDKMIEKEEKINEAQANGKYQR